jgi:hypothetical protein
VEQRIVSGGFTEVLAASAPGQPDDCRGSANRNAEQQQQQDWDDITGIHDN